MTLAESLEEYGADAMRIAMADAGDGLEDANFVQANANAEVLRLASELEWMDLVLKQHEEQVWPLSAPNPIPPLSISSLEAVP